MKGRILAKQKTKMKFCAYSVKPASVPRAAFFSVEMEAPLDKHLQEMESVD